MQLHFLNIGGHSIRVAVWRGDDTSTPLLLMNGIGSNIEMLKPFAEKLEGTEVIAFDVPGTGGSTGTMLPYRLSGLADLVARILVQLGYEQVDVLGVSWGGALAQQFARDFPQRCRRLILAATTTGMFAVPGDPFALLKLVHSARMRDPEYLMRNAGKIYGGVFRTNPDYARRHVREIMAPQTMGYMWQVFALLGWTSVHWLFQLKQPTLIMVGSDDPLVPPANGRIMKLLIPDSRLAILDCGHLFLLTQGSLVTSVVKGFLAGELDHDLDARRDPEAVRQFARRHPTLKAVKPAVRQ